MDQKMKYKLYYALLIIIILLGTGTIFYMNYERWGYVDSFYFSMMTLTTIGYGDLTPLTDGGKIFTSFYALFGIGVMLYLMITVIGGFIFRQERYFDKLFSIRRQEKVLKKQEKVIKEQLKEIKTQKKEISKIKKSIKRSEK